MKRASSLRRGFRPNRAARVSTSERFAESNTKSSQ
jgi:hypothetical protein